MQLETSDKPLKDLIIFQAYKDLRSVFLQFHENFLPLHRDEDHSIELKLEKIPLFDPLYNFFKHQLEVFCKYIDENLVNRFSCSSKFSSKTLVLFILKPNGILQLYLDFCGINAITINSQYLLPLIDEIFDFLNVA